MGRTYQDELLELAETQSKVHPDVPNRLAALAAASSDLGLIVVASGGAKVVAEWACRMQRMAFGCAAVAMTPLEYVSLPVPVRTNTWLLTAGGKHPDIASAAEAAAQRGDRNVVGIIGQSASPLQSFLETQLRSEVVSFELLAGRDGFLATNSVWAMACALGQAYARWLPCAEALTSGYCSDLLAWAAESAHNVRLLTRKAPDLVVLHDAWTTIGAQDLEARLTETALKNLWISDFRNFGHGRHYWFADRGARTVLAALSSPGSSELSAQTLAILPASVSKMQVQMPGNGIAAGLASLAWSIHATAHWAAGSGRDPGRPGVPRFGERLYEGGFPLPPPVQVDEVRYVLMRKCPSSAVLEGASWRAALVAARDSLHRTAVKAVVMDYDGTLVESARRYEPVDARIAGELHRLLNMGVVIGIATGRGDSVQHALQAALSDHALWSRVVVGYHNGASVLRLDETTPDLDGAPQHDELLAANEILAREIGARELGSLRSRKHQITVTPVTGQSLDHVWRATRECLDRNGLRSIRVWLSSHSVDVLSPVCSKINVVERAAAIADCCPDAVLRIGDRGAWPGNDWELLASPLSVSVDECSSDTAAAWNLLAPTVRGVSATAHWLRLLQRDSDGIVRITDDRGAA